MRLSVTQVAERLGVTPQAIRARIKKGTLPAKMLGKQWTIDEKDVKR